MNTLIIAGYPPETKQFNFELEKHLIEKHSASGSVSVINPYEKQWHQSMYTFKKDDTIRDAIQAKISKADYIIFIHPLWWGSLPAPLKNFIDQNLTSGFAYSYSEATRWYRSALILPNGKLSDKQVSVYVSGDTPWYMYALILYPFLIVWYVSIILFTGMRLKKMKYIGGIRKKTDLERKNIISKL
jgi:putative NADPH-quinone reductase